jgi:hypothetical protein
MADADDGLEIIALELLSHARAAEPGVSMDVKAVSDSHRGALEGWEFRLKSQESLLRKVRERLAHRAWGDIESTAAGIKDLLRYTIVFPAATYSESVGPTVAALLAAGYSMIGFKNFWAQKDLPYRGINTWLCTPDGLVFEVQFHTPESWATKQTHSHPLYVQWRSETEQSRSSALFREMLDIWSAVIVPDGAQSLDDPTLRSTGATE